jgi:large subunit ribosomal protein L1
MPKRGKKYREAASKIETRRYQLDEAIELLKSFQLAKFDETVEMSFRLNVDPRKADQMVRGTVIFPHGTGKDKRVLVIAQADKQKEAEDAGADIVAGEEIVDKILAGFLDFDAVVATPPMMRFVGKLGRVLGPRGLMPNPKTGTVTMDVATAVSELKAGKVAYKVDKTGIVNAPIGKRSFAKDMLLENASTMIASILKNKPAAAKGKYVKSVYISSTMSPGVQLDEANLDTIGKG